jgi:hypothetical protein
VRKITEHKYTPDRYMYKEGMKLAARLEEEEAAARAAGLDPSNPPSPAQQVGGGSSHPITSATLPVLCCSHCNKITVPAG